MSQKISLVELIVGRTSMKSTLVTRELRDHILVRNDLKWRSYKYLQNLGNFTLKVELCKLENVVWYITFQDFILNVQKPNFLISDDLCDDKEIVAVPLRNFSSKEKNLFYNIFLSNQMSYTRMSSWFHGSHTLRRFDIGSWHNSLLLVVKKAD